MKTPAELLRQAKRAKVRETLAEHRETIEVLRSKNFTWREIAQFFNDHGIVTDHTKIFRFMQRCGKSTMKTNEIFFVPTAQDYAKALTALDSEGQLTMPQKTMLIFHYNAHNRTASYAEIAQAAHYKDFHTANLQYGTLGRLLGERLSMNFAASEKGDEPFYSSSLGSANPNRPENADYQLVMHHELAKGIELLGWHTSSRF